MPDLTDNHEYKKPIPWDQGTEDEDIWGDQTNENWDQLETEVPIRDTESELDSYTPKDGVEFIATDTGAVYEGDGSDWTPAVREYGSVFDQGEEFNNIIYFDNGESEWVVKSPSGTSRHPNPTSALQQASSNGGSIHLKDSVGSSEAISDTIVITNDFKGPGNRGSGEVYATSGADPVFQFEGTSKYTDLWVRGQNNNIDLAEFIDLGRGSVIQDMTFSRTDGNGMIMAGCQQMTVRNITFGRVGHPSNDTGELRLTDSPNQDLETNAVNIQGFHSHGGNNPQGTSIMMRADHTSNDRPRNIHVTDFNMENGPSSAIPCIEICGRDNWFRGVRAMGLDDCSTVFQIQGPRAPSCHIRDVHTVGSDHFVSNAASTAASSQSAIDDVPTVSDCDIDTTGMAFNIPNFNQTDTPLSVSDCQFYGSGGVIDVTASKDVTPGVLLDNLYCGGQSISVQGARLSVSNIQEATWSSQGSEFGPRLVSDDGSFPYTQFSASTAGGNGVAEKNFSGDFELKDGSVTASASRADGAIVVGTELLDSNGDGDLNMVRAEVRTVSDLTVDEADGTSIEFTIHPRAP